jgi:hypothetical protein
MLAEDGIDAENAHLASEGEWRVVQVKQKWANPMFATNRLQMNSKG